MSSEYIIIVTHNLINIYGNKLHIAHILSIFGFVFKTYVEESHIHTTQIARYHQLFCSSHVFVVFSIHKLTPSVCFSFETVKYYLEINIKS